MTDIVEKNREHWNNTAAQYDTRFEKTISQLIREIQKRKDWISTNWAEEDDDDDDDDDDNEEAKPTKNVRLLDYACGTGLVSRALAPYITQSIGIDLSENMVAQYNLRATNQGLSPSEMSAYHGNLLSPDDPNPASLAGPEFYDFDVAAVGLGFHHFSDPALAAKRLVGRLKSGGVLLIIDFMPHAPGDVHGHRHGDMDVKSAVHTVTHHGFSEDEVKKMFIEAGAGDGFEYQVVGEGIVFVRGEGEKEMRRTVFMARGVKK
ncbi:S-adenosyl-L-methionine-dependent methyltransferase [Xylogone sp. PMI_703]|nr:S-adenosyl-L-methionine-dependent methyltransferase [Xylogone sp. PMI_703]